MDAAPLAFDRARLKGAAWLVGIDEAGRGALAGPVVAAAVAVRAEVLCGDALHELAAVARDSKVLPAEIREGVLARMDAAAGQALLRFAPGTGSVAEIESVNILGATKLAMARAVEGLGGDLAVPATDDAGGPLFDAVTPPSARVLVDGLPLKNFPYRHEAIVKGDACSLIIALASIVAKVTRDRLMRELAPQYPVYGFERHVGYGTGAHRAALRRHGRSPAHRTRFLREILTAEE
ncbi:MAG: ribonuclease HII [Opitutales bacterium]|nr:ribonuclease HII [Opitutales bacterium]